MRIRNSRTSMPILPLAHETVPNASRFRTQDPLINGGFLVQERKPESGSTSRSSNCSRAERDEIWSTFPPQIVLALPKLPRPVPVSNVKTPSISESEKEVSNVKAPSISESEMEVSNMKTLSISELEKQLPLKKRMHYRPKVEKKDDPKQENTAEKEGVKKREKAAVMEINMDAAMICVEGSGEINGGQRGKRVCCVRNCESFVPCPVIDGVEEQEKAEGLFRHEGEGPSKRRRGRPKKKSKRFPRGNSRLKKCIFVLD